MNLRGNRLDIKIGHPFINFYSVNNKNRKDTQMSTKNKILNFDNQPFFVGIDVHQRSWIVTIRSGKVVLKTFSMNPSAMQLARYMRENYPGGSYLSVYEAGYFGYSIHRELKEHGFNNIIVSPTDIPRSEKEKITKSDRIDSRKLSRELENRSLKGIYVPEVFQQELRSLVRTRHQLTRKQSRIKNQIKSYLTFYGHKYPDRYQMGHWSGRFIEYLQNLDFAYEPGKEQLKIYLDELQTIRGLLTKTTRLLREYCRKYNINDTILLLCSVPGVGFTTAVSVYTEVIDMKRFPDLDKLASFVGLIPAIVSSAEKASNLGIKNQHNRYLRNLLIESGWIAIRKDPALLLSYNNYIKRMCKQKAIIKIARKLLNRIRFVWKNEKEYKLSVK
jgi:transposase